MEDEGIRETMRRLRIAIRPVEPSPIFREELRLRLASSVCRDRSPVQVASSGELPRELLVGAALLSVAGALVYFWRTRVPNAAPHAVAMLENIPPAKGMSFPSA